MRSALYLPLAFVLACSSSPGGTTSDGGPGDAASDVLLQGDTAGDAAGQGVCGSANGVPTAQAPATSLCASGMATSVVGSGPWSWSCGAASCAAPLLPPGFFVATSGDDSNPGTITAPFATLTKAQSAMQASAMVKTTYVRAGMYSLSAGTGKCMYGSYTTALVLGSADAGETWSYYPPDGAGSAMLDGGSTSPTTGIGCAFAVQASNVTISGLGFERYIVPAIWVVDVNGFVAQGNVITGQTYSPFNAAAISLNGAPGAIVKNNYIHDVAYMGVGAWSHSLDISNVVVSNNFVLNSCTSPQNYAGNDQGGNDCGAIYIDDGDGLGAKNQSTSISVKDNFTRDVNAAQGQGGGGFGIYLDNGTCNVTATGNVASGIEATCFFIHGGNSDVFDGNFCDLEGDESSTLPFWTGSIMLYQTSPPYTAMTGNQFVHNVTITGSASGKRGGYAGLGTPGNPMSIDDNAYFDYAGTAVVTTGVGGAGSDTNPTYVDPQLSGWTYVFASTSPVSSTPVAFPGLTSGWGPPGFTVPQTGTPPSSPH
jgi:hypothetical protein